PVNFTPRLNPFYCALPYNDKAKEGHRPEAPRVVPWFNEVYQGPAVSTCKDRWIAIRKGNRVAYAQWEDAGPFRTDHWQYVFGNSGEHRLQACTSRQLAETGNWRHSSDCARKDVVGRAADNYRLAACAPQNARRVRYPDPRDLSVRSDLKREWKIVPEFIPFPVRSSSSQLASALPLKSEP